MVRKFRIGILFMLISAFLTSTGQLLWKIGIHNFLFLPIGFLFYGLGAIFMIKSFKKEKISIAYPIMSIGYIISMIYGDIFFNEVITTKKILAITLIILGVFLNSYDN